MGMRFLWKSQLKKKHGKFLPGTGSEKKRVTRKDRLKPRTGRPLFLGTIFLWLSFLGTVVYLVFFSPYLKLTEWQIHGLELVDDGDFRQTVTRELSQKYFGFIPRDTFFLVQPKALERLLLEHYPLIRDVSARRIFPNELSFSVNERHTILLWCSGNDCDQILENGTVLPETVAMEEEGNKLHTLTLQDESNQPLPLQEQVFGSDFVSSVLTFKDGLRTRFGIETENSMRVVSRFANEVRMKTTDDWGIYWSTRIAPDISLNALGLLLDEEIPKDQVQNLQYVDLRTENRVFYRYQDGVVASREFPTPQVEVKTEKKSSEKKK